MTVTTSEETIPLADAKANAQKLAAAIIEAEQGQVTAADAGYRAGWNAALDAADIKIRDYFDRREPSHNAWLTQKALVENILTSLEKETG